VLRKGAISTVCKIAFGTTRQGIEPNRGTYLIFEGASLDRGSLFAVALLEQRPISAWSYCFGWFIFNILKQDKQISNIVNSYS